MDACPVAAELPTAVRSVRERLSSVCKRLVKIVPLLLVLPLAAALAFVFVAPALTGPDCDSPFPSQR